MIFVEYIAMHVEAGMKTDWVSIKHAAIYVAAR